MWKQRDRSEKPKKNGSKFLTERKFLSYLRQIENYDFIFELGCFWGIFYFMFRIVSNFLFTEVGIVSTKFLGRGSWQRWQIISLHWMQVMHCVYWVKSALNSIRSEYLARKQAKESWIITLLYDYTYISNNSPRNGCMYVHIVQSVYFESTT